MHAQWLSLVGLFATNVGFLRQEYCSRLPFPSPRDLPNPGIEPMSLASPALEGGFFFFFFFLPLCQLGSPDVILGPLLSQSSLRILSNILEGEWIIGRSISNLWGWSSYSLLYRAITRQVTPDELGLALVTYVSWVVRAQRCLSNALPNSTCPAANSASPSQDPSLACVGPSWALHAERHWLNAFSVQTIKWNICGAQVFWQKDCYAKSEPHSFTKGWKSKQGLGYMVPWLAVLCFDTGHILMSVSDHKHLAWKLPQCVIFRGWMANLKFKCSWTAERA